MQCVLDIDVVHCQLRIKAIASPRSTQGALNAFSWVHRGNVQRCKDIQSSRVSWFDALQHTQIHVTVQEPGMYSTFPDLNRNRYSRSTKGPRKSTQEPQRTGQKPRIHAPQGSHFICSSLWVGRTGMTKGWGWGGGGARGCGCGGLVVCGCGCGCCGGVCGCGVCCCS